MLVTADLHLREESASVIFDEVLPGLQELALRDPDRVIAILGDIWHIRYRVSVALQNRLLEWLERMGDLNLNVILLPGNHDQISADGANALEVFQPLSHVQVRTHVTEDYFGRWVPYRARREELLEAIRPSERSIVPRVLWAHTGVVGAVKSGALLDEDGVPPAAFEGWEHIFCGHYHCPQTVAGNIVYLGSPWQTRADEAGQTKFVWKWADNTLRSIAVNWGPRYHALTAGAGEIAVPAGAQARDHFRVTVPDGVDLRAVADQLSARGFSQVVVTPQVEATKTRLAVGGGSLEEYARAYAAEKCGGLDPDRLLDWYRVITEVL